MYGLYHRIKISNRRATQRCNVSAFFYAKICSLLARRRSSQPVQRAYWPENVIDWLGRWRPTCVMRHARGQKLQSVRRKWPFYIDLYSMVYTPCIMQFLLCITQSLNDIDKKIPGLGHLLPNSFPGGVHFPSCCLPAAGNFPFLSPQKNANVRVYSRRPEGGGVGHSWNR